MIPAMLKDADDVWWSMHPPENLLFIEKNNKQKNHVHGRHNTLLDMNLEELEREIV